MAKRPFGRSGKWACREARRPSHATNGGKMKKSTTVIGLTCLLLGIPARLYADRAHDLAKKASQQKAVTACNPATLNTQTCHAQCPTGCTDSAHEYDA